MKHVLPLTSLRQGYGGPPKRFALRRKAEATRGPGTHPDLAPRTLGPRTLI
jgi:hypothetical protein